MNVKELRFGNWVLLDDKGQYQIDDWHDLEELDSFPVEHSYCQPLPLTEEWLTKFGFSKHSHDPGHSLDGDEDESCDEYTLKGLSIMNWGNGFILTSSSGKNRVEIKYVHRLQNLFFEMKDEELELRPTAA